MNPRLASAASLALVALSACVVVPLDPRTGQPVVYAPHTPVSRDLPYVAPAPPPAPTVLTARLYPLNERANRAGALTATVIDLASGRGRFTVVYGGDTLQGEATRVEHGYAAFGRVHDEVLGRAARAYAGQRGIANAAGARGVSAQCEYLFSAPGQGTGVCRFSDGAHYQLHF
jgi:hypothetical protein